MQENNTNVKLIPIQDGVMELLGLMDQEQEVTGKMLGSKKVPVMLKLE